MMEYSRNDTRSTHFIRREKYAYGDTSIACVCVSVRVRASPCVSVRIRVPVGAYRYEYFDADLVERECDSGLLAPLLVLLLL